jgi:exosome complex protein LRP1
MKSELPSACWFTSHQTSRTMSDSDPTATLAQLSASLGDLESALEPLLAKPFDDLLESAKDDPLVQARTQVLASYIVHDLIWGTPLPLLSNSLKSLTFPPPCFLVYLKTAGVEPVSHPVMEEIERLKGYFGKLKQAETGAPPPSEPAKRAFFSFLPPAPTSRLNALSPTARFQIDRAAANRFISAAIHSAKATVDPSYTPSPGPAAEIDPEAGPSGTHTRFEDAEVDRLLEDKEDEEDSDDEVEALLTGGSANASDVSAKGKQKAQEATPAKGGKKRAGIDPFAGTVSFLFSLLSLTSPHLHLLPSPVYAFETDPCLHRLRPTETLYSLHRRWQEVPQNSLHHSRSRLSRSFCRCLDTSIRQCEAETSAARRWGRRSCNTISSGNTDGGEGEEAEEEAEDQGGQVEV